MVALTAVVVADAKALETAVNNNPVLYPGLTLAVRLLSIYETLSLQDQVVRLGRQTAYERMVHLLLELRERLDTVDMVINNVFPMPLTQEVLADALGLSIVHVNRTLQQIRRDGGAVQHQDFPDAGDGRVGPDIGPGVGLIGR